MAKEPDQQFNQKNNFNEKELKLSYWIVENKALFKKIGLGLFIFVDAIILLYGLYGFADYLLIGGPRERRAIAELTEDLGYQNLNIKLAARPLEIRSTVLLRSKKTYDAFSFVRNRNEKWLARFNYKFVLDGIETEKRPGFILPGQSKFLTNLGLELSERARIAQLIIEDLKWSRVSAHDIPDYESWSNLRLNFEITEENFEPTISLGQSQVSRASFKVKNSTAFNYWQVGLRVVLYRGATIVGINYITIPEFRSGETYDSEVTWFQPIGQITKIEVEPEVDIFDESVYMR